MTSDYIGPERLVRIGGSHRVYQRQVLAFRDAGISIRGAGSATLGSKFQHAIIPDTAEAMNLLRRVGGTVAREDKRWTFLREDY